MSTNLKRNIKIFRIFLILFFPSLFLMNGADVYLKRQIYSMNEDDCIFKRAREFVIIGKELFIIENFKGRFFKYQIKNNTLSSVKIMANRGQGPGDLYLPIHICAANDMLIIKDEIGLSYFKKDGTFVNKFRVFSPILSFAPVNDKIVLLQSIPDNPVLFNLYENNGRVIKGFGEKFLKIDYSKNKDVDKLSVFTYFYEGKVLSDKKYIYYFNSQFGQVFVFDFNGKKIMEKDISPLFGDSGKYILKKNIEYLEHGIIKKDGSYSVYSFFRNVEIFGNEFYILGRNRSEDEAKSLISTFFILVLNKNTLTLEKKYLIKLEKGEAIYNFAIGDRNGAPYFLTFMETTEDSEFVEFKK